MQKFLMVAMLTVFAAAAPAFAADPPKATAAPANSQQDKMKACNTKAAGMKGDERKAFMSNCLSAKPAEPAKPGSKMAMCNKKTAGLDKDARAKAQSECMKAPA